MMALGPAPLAIRPHLCVAGAAAAIAFYEKAFGAVCTFKEMAKDGVRVEHANIALFGGEVVIHDDFPEFGIDVTTPDRCGGQSVMLNVNLPTPAEVDAAFARAIGAGALTSFEVQDTYWGARFGRLHDPFGHIWGLEAPLKPAGEA